MTQGMGEVGGLAGYGTVQAVPSQGVACGPVLVATLADVWRDELVVTRTVGRIVSTQLVAASCGFVTQVFRLSTGELWVSQTRHWWTFSGSIGSHMN